MAHGRLHSREFKLAVVRQVASGEQHPAQVCREHGLAESLLLPRRKEYDTRGEAAFAPPRRAATVGWSSGSPSWNGSVADSRWRTPR